MYPAALMLKGLIVLVIVKHSLVYRFRDTKFSFTAQEESRMLKGKLIERQMCVPCRYGSTLL